MDLSSLGWCKHGVARPAHRLGSNVLSTFLPVQTWRRLVRPRVSSVAFCGPIDSYDTWPYSYALCKSYLISFTSQAMQMRLRYKCKFGHHNAFAPRQRLTSVERSGGHGGIRSGAPWTDANMKRLPSWLKACPGQALRCVGHRSSWLCTQSQAHDAAICILLHSISYMRDSCGGGCHYGLQITWLIIKDS